MKEHPIIFNSSMVKAILEGRKTQTRREIKPQPTWSGRGNQVFTNWKFPKYPCVMLGNEKDLIPFCPYGKPGDRLWVQKKWFGNRNGGGDKLQQARTMPRWASRITLEITSVKVERLHEINDKDAIAEGISQQIAHGKKLGWKNYLWHGDFGQYGMGSKLSDSWDWQYSTYSDNPVGSFSSLWQLLSGKKHPWSSNPWVWVIEFRRVK